MLARYHFIPKLCWHQNMTVTSVKSMKYLHSTAHEALDVWQLHTEDETPPHSARLELGAHWSLSGDRTLVQRAAEAAGSYFRGH